MIACLAALAPLAQNPAPVEDVRWMALAGQAWRISEARMIVDQVREVEHESSGAYTLAVRGGPMEPGRGRKAELSVISWPAGRAAKLLDLDGDEVLTLAAWSSDRAVAGARLTKPDGSARLIIFDPATGRWSQTAIGAQEAVMNGGPGALFLVGFDAEKNMVIRAASRLRPEPAPLAELNQLLKSGWKLMQESDSQGRPMFWKGGYTRAVDAVAETFVQPLPRRSDRPDGPVFSLRRTTEGQAAVFADFPKAQRPAPAEADPRRPMLPTAVVSRDAVWAALAAGDQAAYISDGVLFARRIQPFGYDEFLAIHKAAVQEQALKMAKQAGLAVQIFAADYDGRAPSGDVTGRLMPYIKNRDILDRVSWTNLNGQDLKGTLNPAATELGYLGTPFGDAVIFADGSVIWRDRP